MTLQEGLGDTLREETLNSLAQDVHLQSAGDKCMALKVVVQIPAFWGRVVFSFEDFQLLDASANQRCNNCHAVANHKPELFNF